jgi:hypothetical protein
VHVVDPLPRAICIVMTGVERDGTPDVKAIESEGGLTRRRPPSAQLQLKRPPPTIDAPRRWTFRPPAASSRVTAAQPRERGTFMGSSLVCRTSEGRSLPAVRLAAGFAAAARTTEPFVAPRCGRRTDHRHRP